MTRSFIATSLVSALLGTSAFAQNPPPSPAPTNPSGQPPAAPAGTPASPAKKEPEKEKTIEEFVKDGYEKSDGLLTLYRKKKGSTDSVMLEVNATQLGKKYMIQATASNGLSGTRVGLFQGQPINDILFYMKKVDDSRIVLIQPNLSYRAPGDPAMERTAERGFPDTILASLDIKARSDDRNAYLVDVTPWFKSDIGEFASALGQGPGSYSIDGAFTYLDSLKNLPENLVVRTGYRLNRVGNTRGARSLPFFVSYNLSGIPETDYVPRRGDIRVGYFQTAFRDISNPSDYNQNRNYIERWNMKKSDPNAPLSPPVKPIKWYISNDVPEKYRDAVRAGLTMYNAAFEAIGIKDAIQVEQMPDNADWDIADVRYNVIRWTQGNPFAIALFRSNPETGEILNAAINMDAVFATGGANEYDTFANPRKLGTGRLNRNPEWVAAFPALQSKLDRLDAASSEPGTENTRTEAAILPLARFAKDVTGNSHRHCDLMHAGAADMQFGVTALSLLAPEGTFNKEEYIKQRVTQVVAHELGHCLGLRHNFIASAAYSLSQLSDPAFVAQNGVTSTVMDYAPFNVGAINRPGVPYYSLVVGPYDKHAIRYGYSDFGMKSPEDELPRLREIASLYNRPELRYMGDGEADAYDPRISRFDLASDPLSYVEKKAQVSDALLRTLNTRLPNPGESFYEFTRQFNTLLGNYQGAVSYALPYIGGIYLSNNYKGDPKETLPLVPVSSDQQKRALALLNRFVFAPTAMNYPKLNYLQLQPNPDNLGGEVSASQRQYPVFDTIASFQQLTLVQLFAPDNQNRLVNSEFRATKPVDTLTLATLYRSVGDNVWAELVTGAEITGLRRDLQRIHLDLLIGTATERLNGVPRDGVTLAYDQLRTLKSRITAALPKAPGEYGKAHLTESLARINRTLTAQTIVN